MKHFDAIIIGTGQAGPSLAARFAGAGKRVAIVEHHRFGYIEYMSAPATGTARVGCQRVSARKAVSMLLTSAAA
jgi:2-polyprenyl-6-methoxyphenol hydroxylase-like FAD-dependent oxidoreductase